MKVLRYFKLEYSLKIKSFLFSLAFLLLTYGGYAQNNPAINISELLGYNARFNPGDDSQIELLRNLKPEYLLKHLKSDEEKIVFWVNVYNSFMLLNLKDTINEGIYLNFYKLKKINIAGTNFSLFDIEHEFIRLGKKNKALKFKKSSLVKSSIWINLRPKLINNSSILLLYKGLYGYPPFQILNESILNEALTMAQSSNLIYYDWCKAYKITDKNNKEFKYIRTPLAVYINNYYPKYEGPKFIEEEKNPWVK